MPTMFRITNDLNARSLILKRIPNASRWVRQPNLLPKTEEVSGEFRHQFRIAPFG
jgi:hypothetical protein